MKRFVIPYDKQLAPVYFRFNLPTEQGYLENPVKEMLQDDVVSWLKESRIATQCAYVADILETDNFPATTEDSVALASLAALLQTLLTAGYTHEAAIISDVISNYILYESAFSGTGSFRKLAIAAEAEKIRSIVNVTHELHNRGRSDETVRNSRSEAAILIELVAFGDDLQGGPRPSVMLQTVSDYAAGANYVLSVWRSGSQSQMEEPMFLNVSRQLSSAIGVPVDMSQQFIAKLEAFLNFTASAALCEAGTIEFLRGMKGLTFNGSLIRHVNHVLRSTSINGFSVRLIEPVANMLALCIHSANWSPFRDDAIITLLDAASVGSDSNWSLVNLALERHRRGQSLAAGNGHDADIIPACRAFLDGYERAWAADAPRLFGISVKNGWFALISKWIRRECLTGSSGISVGNNFSSKEEEAIHEVTQLGFPYIFKVIVEGLGLERCRRLVDRTNSIGQTPLHLACKHRAPKEVFRLLYILGAHVNSQCHLGQTPLHYCLPNSKVVPPVFEEVLKMMSDHSLPAIAPLDAPKIWDRNDQARFVDTRAYDFRVLIHQLLARNADMSIPDQEGMTPVHRAAKEGWGDIIDIFFRHEHGDAEQLQRTCLKIRDYAGHTALDYSRMYGNLTGEDVLVSEMRKRAMEIPPQPAQHLLPLELPIMKFTIGKSKSPVRQVPSSHDIRGPLNQPQPTLSCQDLQDLPYSQTTKLSPQGVQEPRYPSPIPSPRVIPKPPSYSPPSSSPPSIQKPSNYPSPAVSSHTVSKPPDHPLPPSPPVQAPPRFPSPLVYVYDDPEFSGSVSYTQSSSQIHEKPVLPSASQSRTSTFSQNLTLSPSSTLTPSINSNHKEFEQKSRKSTSTFDSKDTEPKSKLRLFEKWGKKK
jgi:hypothetical protein